MDKKLPITDEQAKAFVEACQTGFNKMVDSGDVSEAAVASIGAVVSNLFVKYIVLSMIRAYYKVGLKDYEEFKDAEQKKQFEAICQRCEAGLETTINMKICKDLPGLALMVEFKPENPTIKVVDALIRNIVKCSSTTDDSLESILEKTPVKNEKPN